MGLIERLGEGEQEQPFLSREEIEDCRSLFSRVTQQTISIGDIDERRNTEKDLQEIEDLHSNCGNGNPQQVEIALEGLRDKIESGPNVTLFSKAYAVLRFCDIVIRNDLDIQSTVGVLTEGISTEPFRGNIVLTGAIHAGLSTIYNPKGDRDEVDKLISKSIFPPVEDSIQARAIVGAIKVSEELTRLIRINQLGMRIPVLSIQEGEKTGETIAGEGLPYLTMFLGENRFPQDERLISIVKNGGKPDIRRQIVEPRSIKAHAGIQYSTEVLRRIQGELATSERRKFAYLSLRSLRRTAKSISEIFRKDMEFTDEYVLEHAPFDALTLVATIRTIRATKREFVKQPEALGRAKGHWQSAWSEMHPTNLEGVEKASVMSFALCDYQNVTRDSWSLRGVREHLSRTVDAMALVRDKGRLRLRTVEEVVDLYKRRVWEKELTNGDKLDLAFIMLAEDDSGLMKEIPSQHRKEVGWAARENYRLNQEQIGAVLETINNRGYKILTLRVETTQNRANIDQVIQKYGPGKLV